MEDWKFDCYIAILSRANDPFGGLDLTPSQKKSHRYKALHFHRYEAGILYRLQRIKVEERHLLKSKEDIGDDPIIGVDFELSIVKRDQWVRVLRSSEVQAILYDLHDKGGHPGRDKLLAAIQTLGNWHGRKKFITKYLASCDLCQRTRNDTAVAPMEHIIPTAPNERWQIDFTTIPGYTGYFLVVIDCFSKFVWVKYLPTKESRGVVSFLLTLIRRGKAPKIFHSDNGGEFIAEILNEVAAQFGVEVVHGRPYHPQSQGQVERVNRTLKAALFKLKREAELKNQPFDVIEAFEEVTDFYNASQHSSTKFTPNEVHNPSLQTPDKEATVADVLREQRLQLAARFARVKANLQSAAEKADKVHRKKNKSKLRTFKTGDRVLYRLPKELRQKGQLLYDCVAEITVVHRNNRYALKFLSNTAPPNPNRTFHANEIKKQIVAEGQALPDHSDSDSDSISTHSNNTESDVDNELSCDLVTSLHNTFYDDATDDPEYNAWAAANIDSSNNNTNCPVRPANTQPEITPEQEPMHEDLEQQQPTKTNKRKQEHQDNEEVPRPRRRAKLSRPPGSESRFWKQFDH